MRNPLARTGWKPVGTARKFVIAWLVVAAGVVASAEQRRGEVVLVRPPASPVRFVGPWRATGSPTETRVVGVVIDIQQVPVPYAHVQLRNLASGRVIGEGDANDKGEYQFTVPEPGTYVVEMVLSANKVLGLSNAGSLGRYETLQTRIQLAGRWNPTAHQMSVPVAATSFFGVGSARSTTASVLSLAAAARIRPVDSGEPVSPQ
jgi:hypothetical protein